MPATVNEATKQARMKQTHHHAGVLPSMMPQIFSVIQREAAVVFDQHRARQHRRFDLLQDRGCAAAVCSGVRH
jgi:hypothetical protein